LNTERNRNRPVGKIRLGRRLQFFDHATFAIWIGLTTISVASPWQGITPELDGARAITAALARSHLDVQRFAALTTRPHGHHLYLTWLTKCRQISAFAAVADSFFL
jgi:hypothetical protein